MRQNYEIMLDQVGAYPDDKTCALVCADALQEECGLTRAAALRMVCAHRSAQRRGEELARAAALMKPTADSARVLRHDIYGRIIGRANVGTRNPTVILIPGRHAPSITPRSPMTVPERHRVITVGARWLLDRWEHVRECEQCQTVAHNDYITYAR